MSWSNCATTASALVRPAAGAGGAADGRAVTVTVGAGLGVALGVAEGAALAGTDFVTVTVGTDAGLYAWLPHPAAAASTTAPATSVLHCMWPVSGIRISPLPLSTVCFKNTF